MGYPSRPVAFGQQAPLLSILSQTRTSVEIRGGRPCWAPQGLPSGLGGLGVEVSLALDPPRMPDLEFPAPVNAGHK